MGIHDLQEYVEAHCGEACRPVDLLKIARGLALSKAGKRRGPTNLCLVVDGESCLDRLYGGYYSDWACGGQWNRMLEFLSTLFQACHSAHMELVVFLDGTLEKSRVPEWYKEQIGVKRNAAQVFKHINNKATPPPKVWWIAPMCLRSALRLALRQLSIPVASTMDDHKMEVIGYCRENGFQGVLAHSSEYVIFNPPRYFSSEHLKLTYKGALETTEFIHDDVAKLLDLHPKRFCVLAALLGNHALTECDLEHFLKSVSGDSTGDDLPKHFTVPKSQIVKGVIAYVKGLESVDDLDVIGAEILGDNPEKIAIFKDTVQYYVNGTHDGFLAYRQRLFAGHVQPGSYPERKVKKSKTKTEAVPKEDTKKKKVPTATLR